MGVDINIKSGKKEFSCRLYWVTNLVKSYAWEYQGQIPEFRLEKKLSKKEIKDSLSFLQFCLPKLKQDKNKALEKFDSRYFQKATEIKTKLKELIALLKQKPLADKRLLPKLRGLIRRLGGFSEILSRDPEQEKEEIADEFDEKISLVKQLIPHLEAVLKNQGKVTIS